MALGESLEIGQKCCPAQMCSAVRREGSFHAAAKGKASQAGSCGGRKAAQVITSDCSRISHPLTDIVACRKNK